MDKRVEETLALLSREWRSDHRVGDLASAVNLCASRLEHLFKSDAKISIRELVHERRIAEAAKLIASTHERISAIVYFVGFHDVPNFNRAFRRRFAMSPRQYRRDMQNARR